MAYLYHMKQQQIEGYPDYTIDTKGTVTSYKQSKKGKVLKGSLAKGSLRVCISCNGVQKDARVKRLVAEAFIPNPDNKESVINIDGNAYNNSVENVRWASTSEVNLNNWSTKGKRNSNQHLFKHMRLMHMQGYCYKSIGEALGCSDATVCSVLKKGGYIASKDYNALYPKVRQLMSEGKSMIEIAFATGIVEQNLKNLILRKGKAAEPTYSFDHRLPEIQSLKAKGLSNAFIAKMLKLSGSTVGRVLSRA